MGYDDYQFTLEVTTCAATVEKYTQRTGKVFPFEDYGWPSDTICETEDDVMNGTDDVIVNIRIISKILNYKVFLEGREDDEAISYELDLENT